MVCEQAGADGITVHIRGDRRHIQDADLFVLRQAVTTYLNVEMAATEEMLKIVIDVRPDAVSLVPENPREITTEGGLNVRTNIAIVRAAVSKLRECGILASLFIDPDPEQIEAAREVNAQQVELCTAAYAEATLGAAGIHGEGAARANHELRRLREGAALAAQYGLHVAAGHGLTVKKRRRRRTDKRNCRIQYRPSHRFAGGICWIGSGCAGNTRRDRVSVAVAGLECGGLHAAYFSD